MRLPRNAQIWFPGYVKRRLESLRRKPLRRVWLAITDHYEPFWRTGDEPLAAARVDLWAREWPRIAGEIADSAGRPPRYTFFYPEEEYRPQFLDQLAAFTGQGIGDVEIHLHHDGEGEQNFVDRIGRFKETLVDRHGLLRQDGGQAVFGFIHGNWALDNSRPDGRNCGLNNELTLLERMGCYADFTLPSAPFATQTRMVNTIYWAVDDPARPKSHDTGIPVEHCPARPPGALLMIPGPLGIRSRLFGTEERMAPRIEKGELAGNDMPNAGRARLWLSLAPRIGGDAFVKLFTHGTQERNSGPLLASGLRQAFALIAAECRYRGAELYFASAWQMKQAVDTLLAGDDPVRAVCGTKEVSA